MWSDTPERKSARRRGPQHECRPGLIWVDMVPLIVKRSKPLPFWDAIRRRLGSVGRPGSTIKVEGQDSAGLHVTPGTWGGTYVRGEQVLGEYRGGRSGATDGWFATDDAGELDEDGYLFVEGRLDDVIVCGGENVSPGEIENVLLKHPAIVDACVLGLPSEEWGDRIVAAIVVRSSIHDAELAEWVRDRLRSPRIPEHFTHFDELPYSGMGKLLRRELRKRLLVELEMADSSDHRNDFGESATLRCHNQGGAVDECTSHDQ
jgi:acyl-CoA synthetase (AMP-forming)/AMP-acid ligase II